MAPPIVLILGAVQSIVACGLFAIRTAILLHRGFQLVCQRGEACRIRVAGLGLLELDEQHDIFKKSWLKSLSILLNRHCRIRTYFNLDEPFCLVRTKSTHTAKSVGDTGHSPCKGL